jgi:hypothetical protein
MYQHSIGLYLSPKSLSGIGIHSDLTGIFVTEVVAYSTLTRYLHMMSFTDPIEVEENKNRPSSFSEINEAI